MLFCSLQWKRSRSTYRLALGDPNKRRTQFRRSVCSPELDRSWKWRLRKLSCMSRSAAEGSTLFLTKKHPSICLQETTGDIVVWIRRIATYRRQWRLVCHGTLGIVNNEVQWGALWYSMAAILRHLSFRSALSIELYFRSRKGYFLNLLLGERVCGYLAEHKVLFCVSCHRKHVKIALGQRCDNFKRK